ncbi:hypothetical protein OS493_040216, partial [Desmophyllum pertusum]
PVPTPTMYPVASSSAYPPMPTNPPWYTTSPPNGNSTYPPWYTTPPPNACGSIQYNQVTSPGFPSKYPNNFELH